MNIMLLTDHHLAFLSDAAKTVLSLHLSKCHIVGKHMSRLINYLLEEANQQFLIDLLLYKQSDVVICCLYMIFRV